jgi:hypothetical protein
MRLLLHIAATPSGTEIILQKGDAGNTNISFTFINSRFVICDSCDSLEYSALNCSSCYTYIHRFQGFE